MVDVAPSVARLSRGRSRRMKAEVERLKAMDVVLSRRDQWFMNIFMLVSRVRSYDGMNGYPKPISYQEIECYLRLKSIRCSSSLLDIIIILDDLYIDLRSKQLREKIEAAKVKKK